MTELINYDELINRHFNEQFKSFSAATIARILDLCGMELHSHRVRAKNKSPMTETDCLQYKQAIRKNFGDRVYEMTRVNFMMAGCGCPDCRRG